MQSLIRIFVISGTLAGLTYPLMLYVSCKNDFTACPGYKEPQTPKFDRSLVVDESKPFPTTIHIAFIQNGTLEAITEQANLCLAEFGDFDFVSCNGFSSKANFDYSKYANGSLSNLCYAVRAIKNRNGSTKIIQNNMMMTEASQCPD